MCESGHLESESGFESSRLESESTRIRIHLIFLESESGSNCFESESGFESDMFNVMKNRRDVNGTKNLESGWFESESTLFPLNPNPDSYFLAPNPNPNPAQKALNPYSNPNPDSDSHITVNNAVKGWIFLLGIFYWHIEIVLMLVVTKSLTGIC